MSSNQSRDQKTQTPQLPDTSELLKKMDRGLEEMRKRFEQLIKKMDEDLERIRKQSGGSSAKP
jgi:hypothetical protein